MSHNVNQKGVIAGVVIASIAIVAALVVASMAYHNTITNSNSARSGSGSERRTILPTANVSTTTEAIVVRGVSSNDIVLSMATPNSAGVMSAQDKKRQETLPTATVKATTDTITVNGVSSNNIVLPMATHQFAGLLSAADKKRIDDGKSVGTDLSVTVTPDVMTINSSTGRSATLSAATSTRAGVLTAVNSAKLDALRLTTDLGVTSTPDAVTITNNNGSSAIIPKSSTTLAGVMSNHDKLKLNSLKPNTNLSVATTANTISILNDNGRGTTLPAVSIEQAGVMTAADKVRLTTLGSLSADNVDADEILIVPTGGGQSAKLTTATVSKAGLIVARDYRRMQRNVQTTAYVTKPFDRPGADQFNWATSFDTNARVAVLTYNAIGTPVTSATDVDLAKAITSKLNLSVNSKTKWAMSNEHFRVTTRTPPIADTTTNVFLTEVPGGGIRCYYRAGDKLYSMVTIDNLATVWSSPSEIELLSASSTIKVDPGSLTVTSAEGETNIMYIEEGTSSLIFGTTIETITGSNSPSAPVIVHWTKAITNTVPNLLTVVSMTGNVNGHAVALAFAPPAKAIYSYVQDSSTGTWEQRSTVTHTSDNPTTPVLPTHLPVMTNHDQTRAATMYIKNGTTLIYRVSVDHECKAWEPEVVVASDLMTNTSIVRTHIDTREYVITQRKHPNGYSTSVLHYGEVQPGKPYATSFTSIPLGEEFEKITPLFMSKLYKSNRLYLIARSEIEPHVLRTWYSINNKPERATDFVRGAQLGQGTSPVLTTSLPWSLESKQGIVCTAFMDQAPGIAIQSATSFGLISMVAIGD